MVVKKGSPKRDELEQLANDIDPSDWKKVARKLKIHDPKITAIHKENEEFYEKIYQMLLKWKQANGSAATWKKLNQALIDAGLRELAEKHCCKKLIERDHLSGAVFHQTLCIRYFLAKNCYTQVKMLLLLFKHIS